MADILPDYIEDPDAPGGRRRPPYDPLPADIEDPDGGRSFVGKSARGDLQEALSDAINKAAESSSAPDGLLKWKLSEVTGEKGGIAGLNNMAVTVEVRFSS
jgi:hypothetical protein